MAQNNSKNKTAHPIFDECLELLDTAVWKLLSSTSTLQYVLLVSFSTYACYDYACMHHSVRYTRRAAATPAYRERRIKINLGRQFSNSE